MARRLEERATQCGDRAAARRGSLGALQQAIESSTPKIREDREQLNHAIGTEEPDELRD